MMHLGNLPGINHHHQSEEDEDNETAGPYGAGRGQGAAGDAVDVESSGAGLDKRIP